MASTDEDFSLVIPSLFGDSLAKISEEIDFCKKQHEQLLEDHKELIVSIDDQKKVTKKFKEQSDQMEKIVMQEQRTQEQQLNKEKEKLCSLKEEEKSLMEQLQRIEAALVLEDQQNRVLLTQNNSGLAAFPERKLVFCGTTGDPKDSQQFDMKSHIVYPMDGGTALVTFEDEVVARNIVAVKRHCVALTAEFSITVEAHPLLLMLPTSVEVETEVCSRRILISDLPDMDTETMLNKLEIHFSKSKHGGGEVEECELLPDSGTVVITFMSEDVARGLTQTQYHDVVLSNKKQRLRVTPFLNGTISHFKSQLTPCTRTVLLRNIPPIMDAENLQDLLEIFFQKSCNGGGEIESFFYNPEGQCAPALFGEKVENTEDE